MNVYSNSIYNCPNTNIVTILQQEIGKTHAYFYKGIILSTPKEQIIDTHNSIGISLGYADERDHNQEFSPLFIFSIFVVVVVVI